MNAQKFRWTVFYMDGSFRDVTAFTEAGAKRTAEYAARLIGCKKQSAKARSAKRLFEVGWQAAKQ